MAFKIEDGTGVIDANSNVDLTFAEAYLTDRNRLEENGWSDLTTSEKQARLIEGTDYIEQRWSMLFKGVKEFRGFKQARATLTFIGQPANTETVVIGSKTYTFVNSLSTANDVLIGTTTAESIANLVAATLASTALAGISFGSGTTVNEEATAIDAIDDRILVQASVNGTAGNSTATTTTVANASWSSATLIGGSDGGTSQPLSFPRVYLYDRAGVAVVGMPEKLKQATVEYAMRALEGDLLPDPTVDETGRTVVRKLERVGPIWEDTRYESGSAVSQLIKPFPAADRLLQEYVLPAGSVIR